MRTTIFNSSMYKTLLSTQNIYIKLSPISLHFIAIYTLPFARNLSWWLDSSIYHTCHIKRLTTRFFGSDFPVPIRRKKNNRVKHGQTNFVIRVLCISFPLLKGWMQPNFLNLFSRGTGQLNLTVAKLQSTTESIRMHICSVHCSCTFCQENTYKDLDVRNQKHFW